jgi:AraC-like DNA-binding protein
MNAQLNLRQWYTPVQPATMVPEVQYKEFFPALQLQPYLYCYWELRTTKPLQASFQYRVVTDGCIDVFFEVNNPQLSFLMGFCKQYATFQLDPSFHYIGIRFLPTVFPQLFKINAAELSNRCTTLKEVLPSFSQFMEEQLTVAKNTRQIIHCFDAYFVKLMANSSFDSDPRLYHAIDLILKKRGALRIESEMNTGISTRQLRRLFNVYIGDTPKTFSKVVRFQNLLKARFLSAGLQENKVFYDLGYYDQAHFIREVKQLYGLTPSLAFGR